MNKYMFFKKKRINSKKGLSLMELIIAIMIIMLTISAAIHGLNLSYKSVMMGAEKDDAQSLAQRDCDIIMSAMEESSKDDEGVPRAGILGTNVSDSVSGVTGWTFTDDFFDKIKLDTSLSNFGGIGQSYDTSQYGTIVRHNGGAVDPTTDYKACSVSVDKSSRTFNGKLCDVYEITVYVYYGYKDNMYMSCEGEVIVET